MRQWTESALVQLMACRLFGANPLRAGLLPIEHPETKFSGIRIANTKIFIHEIELENVVCDKATDHFVDRGDELMLIVEIRN